MKSTKVKNKLVIKYVYWFYFLLGTFLEGVILMNTLYIKEMGSFYVGQLKD